MENRITVIFKRFLIFLFFTCIYANETELLNKLGAKSGFLIFREGTELISSIVTNSDGGEYSHVGMLYSDSGKWKVIHATPSEKENQKDGVVIDELEFFIDKNRSKKYAIYEVNANEKEYEKSLKNALNQVGRDFHYDENKGTYCTLLLYRVWQNAGVELSVEFKKINFPILKGEYLFLKEFLSSKKLKLIYKSNEN